MHTGHHAAANTCANGHCYRQQMPPATEVCKDTHLWEVHSRLHGAACLTDGEDVPAASCCTGLSNEVCVALHRLHAVEGEGHHLEQLQQRAKEYKTQREHEHAVSRTQNSCCW